MTSVSVPTLRIALAMRGGVSLSVWIGGAVQEIDRLRQEVGATGGNVTALARLARTKGLKSIDIDVVTGASAGGLNAVLLGAAMASGSSLTPLRDVWMQDADLGRLVCAPTWKAGMSVLDGDYFRRCLQERLHQIVTGGTAPQNRPTVDVLLSVTSVVANPVLATTDPAAPVEEQRIDGFVRLRHWPDHSDFISTNEGAQKALTRELALSGRSTASFPFAFEPQAIESSQLVGRLEFRPERPNPTLLYDGGVVDNMPVGKAARAIEAAPADGPTQRVLLYLHPSPGAADEADQKRRENTRRKLLSRGARPFDVFASAAKSLRTKSLVEDLQQLEAHNARVDRSLVDRNRLLEGWSPTPVPAVAGHQSDLDAERVTDLLVSPWDHLDACVPPVEVRRPFLSGTSPAFVREVFTRLKAAMETGGFVQREPLPSLARGSVRPWSPVIRTASLLIEWCRHLESLNTAGPFGQIKGRIYEVRRRAHHEASELNRRTLEALHVSKPADPQSIAALILSFRGADVTATSSELTRMWIELGTEALVIKRLVPTETTADRLAQVLAAFVPDVSVATPDVDALPVLDALDRALLPLHRGAPIGSLDSIKFLTISGTANTPVADKFRWGGDGQSPEPRLTTLRVLANGTEPDRLRLDPGSKLAGNQLHNFSAFLDEAWRANDWMWGQLDAAGTLVDLLLDRGRFALPTVAEVEEVVTGTPPDDLPMGWADDIVDAAAALWLDRHLAVQAELASPTSDLPTTRAVLLWRRHIEILARELSREINATGARPASTLAEGMKAWDDGADQRRLAQRWGEKKSSALGMRAAFVAWKALFYDTGVWLGLVRGVLAPVLAPAVGFWLSRRRASFAINVFLLGAVLPRTHDSRLGRAAVAFLAVALCVGWLIRTRRRKLSDGELKPALGFWEGWALATMTVTGLVVLGAVFMSNELLAPYLPEFGNGNNDVRPYLAPVLATAIATWVSWFWAKSHWRLIVTLLCSAIVGGWVALAGHPKAVADLWFGAGIAPFQSFWWALVAMALVTTVLGYNLKVADTGG